MPRVFAGNVFYVLGVDDGVDGLVKYLIFGLKGEENQGL